MTSPTGLETDLRALLRDPPAAATPDAGAFAEHVIASAARSRHRRRVRAVAGGLAAAAALGVGAVVVGTTERTSAVPAEPEGCDGLRVVHVDAGTSGADEKLFAVRLVNTSRRGVCDVPRTLALGLLVGRRSLDVEQAAPSGRGTVPVPPGHRVEVRGLWSNWCQGYVRAARVRLSWPGPGDAPVSVVTDPFQPSPPCVNPAAPPSLAFGYAWVTANRHPRPTAAPTPPPADPDPAVREAAVRYAAAIDRMHTCLREHGAVVSAYGPAFAFSVVGPHAPEAMDACPFPKPALRGGFDPMELWKALPAEPPSTPVAYPMNSDGLTYGSLPAGRVDPGALPDLVAVTSSGGPAYVYAYELNGPPGTGVSEARGDTQDTGGDPQSRALDAFKRDGITKVGTYTVGR